MTNTCSSFGIFLSPPIQVLEPKVLDAQTERLEEAENGHQAELHFDFEVAVEFREKHGHKSEHTEDCALAEHQPLEIHR